MFCQPKIIKSNSRKQEAAPSCGKISSTYSTNMCQQMETFSVVSNLSELSEMSTLTNVDEDFMMLKMKSNILPELHCAGLSQTERHKHFRMRRKESKLRHNNRKLSGDINKDYYEDTLEERNWVQLKLSYDKHIEHIIEECNLKVESLQHQISSCNLELAGMKVKLSSSLQAEQLARKELESVTQVRNCYQEQLRQIQSSTVNKVETGELRIVEGRLEEKETDKLIDVERRLEEKETDKLMDVERRLEEKETGKLMDGERRVEEKLFNLEMENKEHSLQEEEKRSYERRLLELNDIVSRDKEELEHLLAAIELEKKERDLAEGKLLSYENLIRDAQVRLITMKQENDAANQELEEESSLRKDLEDKLDAVVNENKIIVHENVELKIITKKLEQSSKWAEEKADNLERLLDRKKEEISTLRSELVKLVDGKKDLMEKFDEEKSELELIIDELKSVKRNIERDMSQEIEKEDKKINLLVSKQEDISIEATESALEREFVILKKEKLELEQTNAELSEKQKELTGLLSSTRQDLKFYISAEEAIRQDFHKQRTENGNIEEKNKHLECHLKELSAQILEFKANEVKLNSRIDDLNKQKENVTSSLEARKVELQEIQTKDQDLKTQICVLKEDAENREALITNLEDQKRTHEGQLAGLHCALKTSFDHIKSLRKAVEESQQKQTFKLDDNSLDQLLTSTKDLQGSSLSSLKLSLFDLKENLRELNIELGSSSVTPSTSLDRETPSFLDSLQDTVSDSVCLTPSLSLQTSPAHFIT